MTVEVGPSVCPHDCPGACSLQVERLAPGRIGRIRATLVNVGRIHTRILAYSA